jgi:signal transduction histidine kinase
VTSCQEPSSEQAVNRATVPGAGRQDAGRARHSAPVAAVAPATPMAAAAGRAESGAPPGTGTAAPGGRPDWDTSGEAAAVAAGPAPEAEPPSPSESPETDDVAARFAAHLTGHDAMQLIIEVAHDMRSPLGSILFLAERLRSMQSGPLTPVQERQIGLIYSAAFGLSALAGDVIELARGGEGLVHQRPIPFSIADLMQSVAAIVQPIAEEKGLTVRLVPPPADARVGQPAALNRVLLNLTTNALKFTAEGGVELAAIQRSRTRLEFSVSDTGRGIPHEVMETLFDAFRRRLKAGDYTFSSAGLGLAICRQLVASMGGDLSVDTSDKGTRFHFEIELPLAPRM